jgi:hypothetical protein
VTDVVELKRDMGLTHSEFLRTFAHVAKDNAWRHHTGAVELDHPKGQIVFRLDAQRERRIAGLHLPATLVRIHFDKAFSATDASAFMAEFDLSFRRGGG